MPKWVCQTPLALDPPMVGSDSDLSKIPVRYSQPGIDVVDPTTGRQYHRLPPTLSWLCDSIHLRQLASTSINGIS